MRIADRCSAKVQAHIHASWQRPCSRCCCWLLPVATAGLSAWDKHVGYRNLCMHPVLQPPPSSPPPKQQRAVAGDSSGAQQQQATWPDAASQQQQGRQEQQLSAAAPPSLLDCCQATLLAALSPGTVCELLQVADCLAPVLDDLRRWATAGAVQLPCRCSAQCWSAESAPLLAACMFQLSPSHILTTPSIPIGSSPSLLSCPHQPQPHFVPACSQAVEHAAQQYSEVVAADLPGFCSLSTACLADILSSQSLVRTPSVAAPAAVVLGWQPSLAAGFLLHHVCTVRCCHEPAWACMQTRRLPRLLTLAAAPAAAHPPPPQDCPEKAVFDGVMKWAGYGSEVESAASACHPMRDLEQLLPCIRFPLMQDAELELVRCGGAGVGRALVVGAGTGFGRLGGQAVAVAAPCTCCPAFVTCLPACPLPAMPCHALAAAGGMQCGSAAA